MNYAAVIREVYNRIVFHAQPEGILHGLKVKKSAEYRLDGDRELPQFTFVDLQVSDTRGTGSGTLACWLRVARKRDWLKEDDAGENGLIDWQNLIMDAVELKPSDGAADQLLVAHDQNGAFIPDNNGSAVELLTAPFSWSCQMDEITDLAFTLTMNLSFTMAVTKRGRRRSVPNYLPLRLRSE